MKIWDSDAGGNSMKITLVLILMNLIASATLANFSGRWRGETILTGKEGRKFLCEDTEINVDQKPEVIEFGDFYYGCGGLALRFHPSKLVYVTPTELTWKDQQVGTVTNSDANLYFIINDKNGRARYTAKILGPDKISYKDEQFDVDPATGKEIPHTVLEGILVRR
jgi:hypothetical protein